MKREDIKRHVEQTLGIRVSRSLVKGEEYEVSGSFFYLKPGEKHSLVVHPHFYGSLHNNPIVGVVPQQRLYHNSFLNKFPKCLPQEGEPCGCDVDVKDIPALEALLVRIGAIQTLTPDKATMFADTASPVSQLAALSTTEREADTADVTQLSEPDKPTALADIEAAKPQLADLSETEREALIAARIGQGRFRAALMAIWSGRCAVTGTDVGGLLRASHVKPWRDSNNRERLDAENGLLLVATLDAAFDAGLISFEDDGTMMFLPKLGSDPSAVLSVPPGCRLTRSPSLQQRVFLSHHRDHVFRHEPLRGEPAEV